MFRRFFFLEPNVYCDFFLSFLCKVIVVKIFFKFVWFVSLKYRYSEIFFFLLRSKTWKQWCQLVKNGNYMAQNGSGFSRTFFFLAWGCILDRNVFGKIFAHRIQHTVSSERVLRAQINLTDRFVTHFQVKLDSGVGSFSAALSSQVRYVKCNFFIFTASPSVCRPSGSCSISSIT